MKNLKPNPLYFLVIVAFILLATNMNQTWLYNPFGWVDQWAYLGQSYFYPKLVKLFPLHPASDLLPVILPSAFFYKFLSPVYANLFRDIFFLSIFLFSLFLHIRRFTNVASSFVVIFLAGGYQYLLSAVGSDYTDGYVITYYALSLYCISLSRDTRPTLEKVLLILSGALFACMVYSAILAIVYLPTLFLLYSLNFHDRKVSILSTITNKTIKFFIFYFIGFGLATFFFSCFYWIHADGFFFINNINKLFGFIGGAYTAPPLSTWITDASWLILPVGVVIASTIKLFFYFKTCKGVEEFLYRLEEKHVVKIMVVVSFTTMLFINFVIKQWSLQFLYFNQTLPIVFLGVGVLLGHNRVGVISRICLFEIGVVIFSSLLTLWLLDHYVITWQDVKNFVGIKNVVLLMIIILFTSLFLSIALLNRFLRFVAIVWLIVLNIVSFSPTFGNFLCWDAFAKENMPKLLSSNHSIFLSTIQLAKFIDKIDPNRRASLWYSELGSLGPLIRQVNAVTYLNSGDKRINKSFPSLNDFSGPIGSEGHVPFSGETLMILSFEANHIQQAEYSLKERGLALKTISTSLLQLDNDTIIYGSIIFLN